MDIEINPKIREVLVKNNIPLNEGILLLLSLYHGIKPKIVNQKLERKIFAAKIVNFSYDTHSLVWNVPLYKGLEKSIDNFDWITEYMDLFKAYNPERRGLKSSVLARMKKFMKKYPSVTKEKILEATKAYLSSVTNTQYVMMSHKFIATQDGGEPLKDFIDSLSDPSTANRSQSNQFVKVL